MLDFSGVIFNGYRERIIQHPIALGKGYAVLLDVRCVLLRVEFGGHKQVYARYAYKSIRLTPSTRGEFDITAFRPASPVLARSRRAAAPRLSCRAESATFPHGPRTGGSIGDRRARRPSTWS